MKKTLQFLKIALFLLLFFIIAGVAKAQEVNFTISKDSVEIGNTIVFKNSSSEFDSTVYYVWTFYDAKVTLTHPTTFENIIDTTIQIGDSIVLNFVIEGNYKIKLEAYGSGLNLLDSVSKILTLLPPLTDGCLLGTYGDCDYLCNGSFEYLDNSAIINGPGILYKSMRWATPKIPSGFPGASGTPDIFSRFATNPDVWVPYNAPGYYHDPVPSTGNNYAGVICYQVDASPNEYREYAQARLLAPLIPNQKYYIGMKVSIADNSAYMIDTIGINLSINQPGQFYGNSHQVASNLFYKVGNPLNQYTLEPQIRDKVTLANGQWQLISDTMIGNEEEWLTIGNFKDDAQSNASTFSSNSFNGEHVAYYFIDSVFVIPVHSAATQTYVVCDSSTIHLVSSAFDDQFNTVYYWGEGNTTMPSFNYNDVFITGDTTIYCSAYSYYNGHDYWCPIVDTFHIVLPLPPNVIVNSPVSDCGGCDTLTVTGTNVGTYLWSTGATTQSIVVCPLGTTQYTVTVTNALGCNPVVLTSTVIVPPAPPKPQLEEFVNNICDSSNFRHLYKIADPVTGYNYHWNIDPDSAGSFIGSNNGTHVLIRWNPYYANQVPGPLFATITVTTTDNHRCSSSSDFKIFDCCRIKYIEGLISVNDTNAKDILDTNIYSEAYFLVNGFFHINMNLNIVSSAFYMGPEATIIVDSGYNFDVTGSQPPSRFLAGCDYMWKGVVVNSTALLTLKNSRFNDAYVGIDAKGNAPLNIAGNIFTNNDIGIRLTKYINPPSGRATIYGNTFTSLIIRPNHVSFYPPLNVSYQKPYAGLVVEQSNNTTIGAIGQGNIFRILHNGIRSKNSDINVIDNRFYDIKKAFGGLAPFPINDQSGVGVWSVRTTPFIATGFSTQGISIGGSVQQANSFYNCDYGVYLYNNRKIEVRKNNFHDNYMSIFAGENTVSKSAVRSIYQNTIDTVRYCGIDLQSMQSCYVQFNNISKISLPSNGFSTSRTYGILAEGCYLNTIYGNSVSNSNSTTDKRLEGICTKGGTYLNACNNISHMGKAMAFYGNHTVTSVMSNSMSDCEYGLYLNHGIIGPQGYPGLPSENEWIGNFTAHTYTANNATVYDLFVRGFGNPSSYYPTINIGDASCPYFNPNGTNGYGRSCQIPAPDPVIFSSNKETARLIYDDAIEYSEYEKFNEWLSDFNLYKYLYQEDRDSLTDWMIDFMENYNVNDKNLITISELIDSNDFKNAQSLIENTRAQSDAAGYLLTIYGLITEAALSENNATDDMLFYEYQVEMLRNIASACPYEYGNAVYLARLLLSRIEPNVYFNSCEDMIEERKFEKPKGDSPIDVKVYPNPAKDEFTIEFTGDISGQETSVELYNIYGSLIKKIQSVSESKIVINTRDLSAGIYYYSVSLNNHNLTKDKIVVIK